VGTCSWIIELKKKGLWMAMKPLLFAAGVVFVSGGLCAQTPVWQPSPGHSEVPIWPGAVPDQQRTAGREESRWWPEAPTGPPGGFEVYHVSRPTITVYSPREKNAGVAVVVFPGGGYTNLAINLEGTEVCDWLTSRGITCVLLKYRVPGEEYYPKPAPYPKSGPYPESPMALEDAQRTLGLVRLHAAEWHIDPHKIGVLGFSAGGHLVAATSTHFAKRLYPAVDDADKESCRPDFAVALYPGHLTISATKHDASLARGSRPRIVTSNSGLNPDIQVTRLTPPTFLVQAVDDPVDSVENSLVYFAALKKAGVPVEIHLYAHGGHAFGLRPTKLPISQWPRLVETWLGTIGMISG
jgi:acetyl esterase/lipase